MFPSTKLQKYIIAFRVPGSHVTIQASIEMTAAKAESLLPAFGMKPVRPMRLWWIWRPKTVYLSWEELEEEGRPVQNPRFVWCSFQRLAAAEWTVESREFQKFFWWIFN